jgi:hypothetical protein
MPVLIGKRSLLQPLHAVGDVKRLIVGDVENRVGGRDSGYSDPDQNDHSDDVLVQRIYLT